MTAAWAAAGAALAMLAVTLGGVIARMFYREGKTDAVLERLTEIAEDHENRLRDIQAGAELARRQRGARW